MVEANGVQITDLGETVQTQPGEWASVIRTINSQGEVVAHEPNQDMDAFAGFTREFFGTQEQQQSEPSSENIMTLGAVIGLLKDGGVKIEGLTSEILKKVSGAMEGVQDLAIEYQDWQKSERLYKHGMGFREWKKAIDDDKKRKIAEGFK